MTKQEKKSQNYENIVTRLVVRVKTFHKSKPEIVKMCHKSSGWQSKQKKNKFNEWPLLDQKGNQNDEKMNQHCGIKTPCVWW